MNDRRKQLVKFMASLGVNAAQYAALRGVSRSVVCKFLNGKDVWLSTWDKLDPGTYHAPQNDPTLSVNQPNVRTIS
jgi:hypothetical protein